MMMSGQFNEGDEGPAEEDHQSLRYIDWCKVFGEKQEVYSRDKVKHSEKSYQLFIKTMMKVDDSG